MSLEVYWDKVEAGRLDLVDARSRDYTFSSTDATRPISLSLPLDRERFDPTASRPFFEALLPEGPVREQVASQLRIAVGDSYGLLKELGRDCAGALQIVESKRLSETPTIDWLSSERLEALIEDLPRHPLGIRAEDERLRLSLAGVQNKAVLARDASGRFGRPLNGMPSTHIVKPEPPHEEFAALAANEYFCMRLAARCGLPAATVELLQVAGRSCLVVERFDRVLTSSPPARVHQEDLCQALGLTPDFKYQQEGWQLPSYSALAELLDDHSPAPGIDRLGGAMAAVFNFLVGNADAHAKNISLLHVPDGVRLAPLYDVVSTSIYPELHTDLALAIGDESNPKAITSVHWSDLADDFGLNPRAFESAREQLAQRVTAQALALADEARNQGWHRDGIEGIVELIAERSARV